MTGTGRRWAAGAHVGVKALEHRLVDGHLVAGALLKPQGTEGAHELAKRHLPVPIDIEVAEDLGHVVLLVASDRRLPLLLVERPAALESHLELPARLGLQPGVELFHGHVTVAVHVEALEHRLVHLHLGAVTLRQAEGAEGTRNLVNVELAVAVAVELRKDLFHVVLLVASDRRVPLLLVERPAALESQLELPARLGLQPGVELFHGHVTVAVHVEALEHRLVHLHLGAVTLRQAEGAEGTRNLVNVELAVAVAVELRKDLFHVVLLVASDRRVPCRLVKLPPTVEQHLDLLAQLWIDVLLNLHHVNETVAVGVEALEHRLVHVRLFARPLLKAQRTERACQLVNVELAIAIRVKLLEHLGHVPARVPRDRLIPRLLVELPALVELLLDLAARLRVQAGLELLEVNKSIAVGVKALKHRLIHLQFRAVALR